MKFKVATAILVVGVSFSSLAIGSNREVITPSGLPEVIFPATPSADVASKVASHCMDAGWQVTSQQNNQIVCEVPMNAMRSVLTQALIGNSYSTTPRQFVKVNIAQIGDHSRAQAMAWVETQMVFGQMRQQPFTDDNTFNNLIGFLTAAGGELPPGSQFPGIYIGFGGQAESDGKGVSAVVLLVTPGTPGEEAGLLTGDRIMKVNGSTFKSMEDFTKKLSKLSVGLRYPLLIKGNYIPS